MRGAVLACLLAASTAIAQSAPTHAPLAYLDWVSHMMVGGLAAVAGVLAHRAWSRRRWHSAPAATVIEAVLAVDLVNSTQLATRHGETLAMRARNVLERRTLAAAEPRGATFVENTGDGCMMTFPSVGSAVQAASKLLQGLHDRPPDMAPGPPLEVRAAVTYGEILLDARGARHGAAINKAFRLMGVPNETFVTVEGEQRLPEIPDRNRVFLDEDAANELGAGAALRQVGVCRLKGFSGFHLVYTLERS
jgi:class 3 adenylate cyclase